LHEYRREVEAGTPKYDMPWCDCRTREQLTYVRSAGRAVLLWRTP
jgi:hypothetical protein